MQSAKFPEAVEAHIRLGVNVRHADQQVRGTMALPHGLGRDVSVAVFAQGDKAREAEAAGADAVGGEDLAERVQGGWTDFDVAIATPDMMPVVGKLGRILGPQGKMPNPKVGTVTEDVGRAVEQAKAGRVEYRTDRTGIIHLVIGRADFDERRLLENYAALIDEIVRAKPAAAKGRYIRSVTLTTTMGPGVQVDPTQDAGSARGGPALAVGAAGAAGHPRSTIARPTARVCAPETVGSHRRKSGPGGGNGESVRFPARLRAGFSFPGPERDDEKRAESTRRSRRSPPSSGRRRPSTRSTIAGLSVPQAAELRASLREHDATFRVVKNTLTLLAADKAGVERAQGAGRRGPDGAHVRARATPRSRRRCSTPSRARPTCSSSRAA